MMSQEWCHLQKCLNLKFIHYFSDIFIEELMSDAKVWTFFLYFNVLFLYLSMYSTLIILEIPKGWETQGVMHVVWAFPRDSFQRQEICPNRVQLNELHKIVPRALSPSCRRFYNIFLQRNELFESVGDNLGKSPKKRILEEFCVSPDIVFLSVLHVLAILVPVLTCLCK